VEDHVKTRTEEEMLALILSFAQTDDRIRVVVMNGLRTNPNAEKDIFQDYDIVYIVTSVKPFRQEARVVPYFGVPIIVQKVEDQVYRPGCGDGRYTYKVQFTVNQEFQETFDSAPERDHQREDRRNGHDYCCFTSDELPRI